MGAVQVVVAKDPHPIEILEEATLTDAERDALRKESEANRQKGIRRADEICKEYRRIGRFFDEIVAGGL